MAQVTLEHSDLPMGQETSLEEAYANFLTDPNLIDIALEGTDGVRVPANHFVLAARSNVFRSMLLGDFSEASKDVVQIGYAGQVLEAIVEYVVTNTAGILKSVTTKRDATKEDLHHVQALMELAEAALYFNLPLLCQKAFLAVAESLTNAPLLSFQVLEKESPSIPKFKALAMSHIFFICPEDLHASAVSILSEPVLEDLLREESNQMDEFLLFEILRVWSHTGTPDRKEIAVEMVKHIHLEWIDTDIITTTVASSGLVSQEQLLGIYRKQALAAHSMHGRIFKKSRHELIWKRSGTEVSKGRDLLNYPPMTSGVYQWTCEVANNTGGYNWLGVVANKDLDLERSLRDQEGVFLFSGHEGMAYTTTDEHHLEATYNLPTFGAEKSKVTLILDLEDKKSGGKLSASVNGGEPSVLFERMRDYCNDKNNGFVPFVSSRSPDGEVRVIEVIKLRSRQLPAP